MSDTWVFSQVTGVKFFSMDPEQRNSFNWNVRELYLDKDFGMKEEKAMLMNVEGLACRISRSVFCFYLFGGRVTA